MADTMTRDMLPWRGWMTELGWSDGYLARRLGVHRNTVSLWATEKVPVPEYATEYLRVCWLAMHILSEDYRTDWTRDGSVQWDQAKPTLVK